MAILNYSTKIEPEKTVAEIQAILGKHGAKSIFTDYDEYRNVSAVGFLIMLDDKPINFRLPCNVDGVLSCLNSQKGVPNALRNRGQARRVAWRIVKDWIQAQLALVEAKQAELAEIFLPYAIDGEGRTVFQAFRESHIKQLTAGSAPDGERAAEG
jgi:hypothetical protein